VQNQPVVRVSAKGLRYDLFELGLDLIDGLAGGEASPVADAKNVGVDRECFLAERCVEHDVGGLAPNARQLLQLFPGARDFAAVMVDQGLAERNHVLGLGVE
jgi:hypothetical protein